MTHSHHRRHSSRPVARLSRARVALTWSILAFVWATGTAWLILHHLFPVQGEFGATPNPMERWILAAHGAAAFAALWLAGVLWVVHLRPAWERGSRSPSGALIVAALLLLTVTGYLLYYAGGETLRARAGLIHWMLGLVSPLPLIVHVALRSRRAR